MRLPVDLDPEVPVQPVGETEQDVALPEVQVIDADVLCVIVIGPLELLTLMLAVETGSDETDLDASHEAVLPPFCPRHVHEVVLPCAGNDGLEGEALPVAQSVPLPQPLAS